MLKRSFNAKSWMMLKFDEEAETTLLKLHYELNKKNSSYTSMYKTVAKYWSQNGKKLKPEKQ